MRKFNVILGALALIFGLVLSCENPVGGIPGQEGPKGSLTISVDDAVSKSLTPALSMNPASYEVIGTGPNGASFNQTISSGTSVTVTKLAFGSWSVSVTAKNASGTAIGVGTGSTTVVSNASTTLNITVKPYDGFGTLSLGLTWPAAKVQTAQVTASLTPSVGAPRNLSFSVDGAAGSASFSANDVSTGYHTLVLKLLDNGYLNMGAVEIVRIVKDQTTSGNFNFTNINQATGTINVNVTPDMALPLDVSISGASATKPENQTMNLSASVLNYADNVTYVWYVNGDPKSTGASFTFDSTFAQGYYRIDVTAFSADGKRAGSATTNVEVVGATTNSFVSTWKTDYPGISASNQIELPLVPSGTYNFNVDWGDGTSSQTTSYNDPDKRHTYQTAGTYTINIKGVIIGWSTGFQDYVRRNGTIYWGDSGKLVSIDNWGILKFGKNSVYCFRGCLNLTKTGDDLLILSETTDLTAFFEGCKLLNSIPKINEWDTSKVTVMDQMFSNVSTFNQPIGTWNVANVTSMSSMFAGASAFNQPIGSWNTANVTNMSNMFAGASAFNQPISNWNTANANSMSSMFAGASAFNQPIGNWNTANVNNMSSMFAGASAFNQPIGNWNTSSVTNMGSMFAQASSFNQTIDNWNTANVNNMYWMFLAAVAFNQNIGSWDVTSLGGAGGMFMQTGLSIANYDLLLNGWGSQTVKSGVELHADVKYSSAGASGRQALINKGWTIGDGGLQ